jgi:hypothetical protein
MLNKAIEITYQVKTAYGNYVTRSYATKDGREYQRIVDLIHLNPEEYKVVNVRHI